ncbi:hypothetical protein BDB00DRAFT_959678 [Zychaea mexicana]|uniref:uncharacterized protein n=1 Tax=Zychaea mexicana TaxID=64656 RepID=UPI0022FDB3A6|nr:uncharacterized protein BDB00DRAFT_959678 [Zychaea mexicana]KAI9491458.1 hypothetical protein BDB00DRAFT_959678 [Zychaea mexicana]
MAPARQQVDKATLDEYLKERRPEGGTYNIWHNRWKGLERDWSKKGVRAKFKCDVARDSGDTVGTNNRNAYFCLFFAKGMCAQGAQCSMLHRIPNESDEVETTIDCFGRDKFMEFRQDMGGVGSFNTQNKTLYVGRIASTGNMRDVVIKHFAPFGELERVKLLRHRGVAFVAYKSRNNAEFAREAMMNQGLDNNEIINVRWATAEQSTMKGDEERGAAGKDQQGFDPRQFYERQNAESELPAEYTQIKREVDEDGFREMELKAKRQRIEQQTHDYYADASSAQAIYGYTQQTQQPPQQSNPKSAGIIPQNVLSSLKTLKSPKSDAAAPSASPSSAAQQSSSSQQQAVNPGGLGNLASYGSDSEDEDY